MFSIMRIFQFFNFLRIFIRFFRIIPKNMKINLYTNNYFNSCKFKSLDFKNNDTYYSNILCLKNITNKYNDYKSYNKSYENIKDFISNNFSEIIDYSKTSDKLCVLEKNHKGKCNCNPHNLIFKKTNESKKIINKIINSIYVTPGNDGYVFKNRASRLYPIILSSEDERIIKNKNKKLKCAIPIKDHSTPFMLATAYFDFLVFILNIKGVDDLIIKINNQEYLNTINNHKEHLQKLFNNHSRDIFDDDGFTICPVIHKQFTLDNIIKIDRFKPNNMDTQLGHIISRNDLGYTIYGGNICLISRKGNLILGENSLLENTWINELKNIVNNSNK